MIYAFRMLILLQVVMLEFYKFSKNPTLGLSFFPFFRYSSMICFESASNFCRFRAKDSSLIDPLPVLFRPCDSVGKMRYIENASRNSCGMNFDIFTHKSCKWLKMRFLKTGLIVNRKVVNMTWIAIECDINTMHEKNERNKRNLGCRKAGRLL